MTHRQHRYLYTLGCIILLSALIRCATGRTQSSPPQSPEGEVSCAVGDLQSPTTRAGTRPAPTIPKRPNSQSPKPLKHPISRIKNYREEFPDTNELQLSAARQWGVEPVENREEAENRKMQLVYIAASPYYSVLPLHNSIPYLVPRAALLLHDIGRNYFDSLAVKGLPLHHFLVSSVMRTTDDVARLKRKNRNATDNSCHLYGTTFDIAYNKYVPLTVNQQPIRREVTTDSLKAVLAEVLRDMRNEGRCYIKYEVKQGCFHITAR